MSDEILTLERVRRLARVPEFTIVRRLCDTVEHWHTRAADNLEANAQCAIAKHAAELRLQETEIERDRLRSEVEHWRREAEEAENEREHDREEELRLLRDVEAAELEYPGKRKGSAWAALRAFRERQKERL